MATLIGSIVGSARTILQEKTAKFWSDAELLELANFGAKDLWKGLIDLYHDHFVTIDSVSMSLAADSATITGVPADLFRVLMIQPASVGTLTAQPSIVFQPRTLTHPEFVQAQAARSLPTRRRVVFYAVVNAGAPVGAPSIRVAPRVGTAVPLEVWYIPTLAALTIASTNPIPGESDKALIHYLVAFARGKERADSAPDPEHLSIYATEKRNLLTVASPRSDQEPDVVVGFWQEQEVGQRYG